MDTLLHTLVDGKYYLEGIVGTGATGTVFRARHTTLERYVAVKILHDGVFARPEGVERFRREAIAVARLTHPHIVRLYDYGVASSVGAYIVMELLEGKTLADEIEQRDRIPVRDAIAVAYQACSAVHAAHLSHVLHRDLKPGNIVLDRVGPEPQIKLLDFGFAKLLDSVDTTSHPSTFGGIVLGSLSYMAPEQCEGSGVDECSDIYSLGCVLYEMLVGVPPFAATTADELARKHLSEPPRPPSEIDPSIPRDLDGVVMQALAKDPLRRFRSAAAFARALEQIYESLAGAARGDLTAGERLLGPSARRKAFLPVPRTAEQPAVREASARRHNIPRQLTSFVGRERSVREVRSLLRGKRLITVRGPGGIGKTRLALQVALASLDDYPDGVWLVELAPIEEPSLVAKEVARALGIRDERGRTILDTVTAWLQSRNLLLVVDNCEHVSDAARVFIEALLARCGSVRVLATSRHRLSIAGESIWALSGLTHPCDPAGASLERLGEYSSVRLFVERARLSSPEFALTPETAGVVSEICRLLDGIPLAIELAAAGVNSLTVEEILARARDPLRMVGDGSCGLVSRQQTLRATLDWSYELLSSAERLLLCRLSVFAGDWSLDAAETVCTAEGVMTVSLAELLERLVDRSLVNSTPSPFGVRYSMLETVRQYARERLEGCSEAWELADRHQAWALRLSREARASFRGRDQELWRRRMNAELDNIRAALRHGGAERRATRLEISSNLAKTYWQEQGMWHEAAAWIRSELGSDECGEGGAEPSLPPGLRADALVALSVILMYQTDTESLIALAERAVALFDEHRDNAHLADARRILAIHLFTAGRCEQAIALHAENLRLCNELDDGEFTSNTLMQLGILHTGLGNYEVAQSYLERALDMEREFGDENAIVLALHNLGDLYCHQGNYLKAFETLQASLELGSKVNYRIANARTVTVLGNVATATGDYGQALAYFVDALDRCAELNDLAGIVDILENSAWAEIGAGHLRRSLHLAGAAESARRALHVGRAPVEQSFMDRLYTFARAHLSVDEIRRMAAEGEKLSLDDAVATIRRRALLHDTGALAKSDGAERRARAQADASEGASRRPDPGFRMGGESVVTAS